jgi:polysaccharide export outer membrane protein
MIHISFAFRKKVVRLRGLFCLLSLFLLHYYPCYAQTQDYIIGPEDTIQISVWGNEKLSLSVPVRPDGKISLPLLDDIQASGLTPLQLKEVITKGFKQYMDDPQVTIIVTGINSFKVFVQGEVNAPGVVELRGKTTLMDLISIVGGIKETADLHKSYLIRDKKRLAVDFYKLIEERDTSQNIPLRAGDLIVIADNYASRITVVGQVNTPTTLTYREGMTVLDAILQAGGFTPFAKTNKTIVLRNNNDKEKKRIIVKMKDVIEDGKIEKNIVLKPGDTIIVPKSWF